jgi:hypothetical protein
VINLPTTESRYNELLDLVSKVIAHPHTTIVPHDKHRALILVSYLSNDQDMIEYLYSQLTQEDFKAIKQIKESIYGKKITN